MSDIVKKIGKGYKMLKHGIMDEKNIFKILN